VKKFTFPLERVLTWRRTQSRVEEAVLARLHVELQGLDRRLEELDRSLKYASDDLRQRASTTAPEIAALEHYRTASAGQAVQIAKLRADLQQKIEHQNRVVAERRRDTRLLERLRERRLEGWNAELAREVEQMAEESYISRLVRALQVPDELK
jgi:flagellar export protein FliJ